MLLNTQDLNKKYDHKLAERIFPKVTVSLWLRMNYINILLIWRFLSTLKAVYTLR